MTAVEWLIEQLQAPCRGIPSHIVEQSKKMETREYALFLRWILKHYSTKITDEGMFGWVNSMGEDVDIEDIVKHYKSDNQ